MTFRIGNTALVGEQRRELARSVKDIRQLLNNPPGICTAGSVVMVAATDPVHVDGIQHIAPLIEQCAVSAAIHGYLAVAMEFAADDVVCDVGSCLLLAARFCPTDLY